MVGILEMNNVIKKSMAWPAITVQNYVDWKFIWGICHMHAITGMFSMQHGNSSPSASDPSVSSRVYNNQDI